MSLVLVATIVPTPEHRDEVIAALEAAIARVHQEDDGCELYALHEGPDRLLMIEKWASSDALRAHGKSPASLELNARLAGKLAAAPDLQIVQPHPAGDPARGSL
jgi:quinol monooxygenase YgiN